MKVVGSTCCALSSGGGGGGGGEEAVRCLSDQSLSITRCSGNNKLALPVPLPVLELEQMTVFLQDMNSCYSALRELVPTLQQPANRKASKMEILQGVIDYIWDLQVELDLDTPPGNGKEKEQRPVPSPGISVENGSSDDRTICR